MSERLDRLLSIVIKLLSYNRVQTAQLADDFGVSSRTIYRDLQTISLSGVPVVAYQGKGGGWEIDSNFLLDRRLLTVDDIAHIAAAVQSMDVVVSDPRIKETLDKVKSLMIPSKQKEIFDKMNHIVIDNRTWLRQDSQKELLERLYAAISKRVLVSCEYESLKGERLNRQLEPMTLFLKGSTWYLFAYCLHRNDYRLFRLSRMQDVTVTDQYFDRREGTVTDCKERSEPNDLWVDIQLKFHQSIRLAIGDAFGLDGILLEGEYGFLDLRLPEGEWLYGMLLGFGAQCEVLSPKRLSLELKQRAENIVSLYQ